MILASPGPAIDVIDAGEDDGEKLGRHKATQAWTW